MPALQLIVHVASGVTLADGMSSCHPGLQCVALLSMQIGAPAGLSEIAHCAWGVAQQVVRDSHPLAWVDTLQESVLSAQFFDFLQQLP